LDKGRSLQSYSTLAAALYGAAIQNLDTWISEVLRYGQWDSTTNIFIALMCVSVIPEVGIDAWNIYSIPKARSDWANGVLASELQHVVENPLRATFATIQTLTEIPEIVLLKFFFKVLEYNKFGNKYYFDEDFSCAIESLVKLIAATDTKLECGKALKECQQDLASELYLCTGLIAPCFIWICELENHKLICSGERCLNRKYLAISPVKKDLKSLARAAMDCFDVGLHNRTYLSH